MKRAVVLLADGARADVIDEELAAGRLPNIARYLVEPGAHRTAVTSFPSTTGPAYLPFLTGCLPGTCNVPGIRWVDKPAYDDGRFLQNHRSYVGLESFLMTRDIREPIATIFELVPGAQSIFNPIARGAGRGNRTRISRIWYWYYAHLTDHWSFADEAALAKIKRSLSESPPFLFAVLPGIDEYAHLAGCEAPEVRARYAFLDRAVGEIAELLQSRGEWGETALFVVSDHGLSTTHTHFCVNTFLDEHGLPPFFYPLIFHKRGKRAANMVSGNGMSHLSFRNADGWARRTVRAELETLAPGLIDDLLRCEAVDIAISREPGEGLLVESRRGRARLRLGGERLRYAVEGSDPFGYGPLPEELTPEDSLARTIGSDYPDAPFQIAHLMTAPRAGDVVLSATPGFDLRLKYEHPEHHASHGSLHATHMRVPILANLPLADRPARTVDIFPTILMLLGHETPGYVDGRSLLP